MTDIYFPPTISKFFRDPNRVKFIVGPVGSGKTIGLIHYLLYIAASQDKASDGYRYTRFAICRYTLQALKNTVVKDLLQFFGEFIHYKISDSTMLINIGDIRSEILLLPLETPENQKRLLSTQLTAVMFNEFADIDVDLLVAAYGRCGRYPSGHLGVPNWFGVIGDTNPGLKTSPWYKLLYENLPKGWSLYHQPAPIDKEGNYTPDGEVREIQKTQEYYQNLLAGASPAWAERYIFAQWGEDVSGEPVYKNTFVPGYHIAKVDESGDALKPRPGRLLLAGLDTGRHPAMVLGQIDEIGRLLILGEAYGDQMGMEKFLQEKAKPLLYSDRFRGVQLACVIDPAGVVRSNWSENSVYHLLKDAGFSTHLASTNNIEERIKAVEHWLLQQRSGGPAFLIDPINCPRTTAGLRHEYKYKEKKMGGVEDKPTKDHPVSDYADALQYLALGTQQNVYGSIVGRSKTTENRPPPDPSTWT